MTTETTETTEIGTETTETGGPPETGGPKELREALKKEKDLSHGYRSQLLTGVFEELGLNPETGLGKAIAKEYDGEPTLKALTEYATSEYGYEAPEKPENPKEPQITEGQKDLDNVNTQSQSVMPSSESEALKKAHAEGDYATAGAIKANRMERMFKRR